MAWEYVDLPEIGTYGTSTLINWDTGLSLSPNQSSYVRGFNLTLGNGYVNYDYDNDGARKENTTSYGLFIQFYHSAWPATSGGITVSANGTTSGSYGGGINRSSMRFAINRDTEDAYVIVMLAITGSPNQTAIFNISSDAYNQRHVLYNLIIGQLPPVYNWQSVPSVTGKGETVNLSTLNDINDGDQVITTDTSKFNIASENNLYTLIAKHL